MDSLAFSAHTVETDFGCINGELELISQCVIICISIGYIFPKKRDYFFPVKFPDDNDRDYSTYGRSFTSCSQDVNVELTV